MFAACSTCGNAMYIGDAAEGRTPDCPHCGTRPARQERRPSREGGVAVLAPRLADSPSRTGLSAGDRIVCEVALWFGVALVIAAAAIGYWAFDTHSRQKVVTGRMSTHFYGKGLGLNAVTIRGEYRTTVTYSVRGKQYEKTWRGEQKQIADEPAEVYYLPERPEKGSVSNDVPSMAIFAAACLGFGALMLGVGVYGRSRRASGEFEREKGYRPDDDRA